MNYYNENDPFAAAWLRNLIAAGLIPAGYVDERSIRDVKGKHLEGYSQCHFFAGIAGWPLALALAGWSPYAPVWTGSCPCQPFSVAGSRGGTGDERHLWPEFHRLIAECRPAIVFGEQVASKDGRQWLAGVRADLERLGYAVGAADLCAAGVGAPHIRQRLFWVADTDQGQRGRVADGQGRKPHRASAGWVESDSIAKPGGLSGGLGDPAPVGWRKERPVGSRGDQGDRPQGCAERSRPGFWSGADWLSCLDGKARRTEPGVFPLAHGVSGRVGRLRAYGNAIVPQIAATFIRAFRAL